MNIVIKWLYEEDGSRSYYQVPDDMLSELEPGEGLSVTKDFWDGYQHAKQMTAICERSLDKQIKSLRRT